MFFSVCVPDSVLALNKDRTESGTQTDENTSTIHPLSTVDVESESEPESSHSQGDSDYVESSENEEIEGPNQTSKPTKVAFIVYWTSLLTLITNCLQPACSLPAVITKTICKGSQLIIRLKCNDGHTTEWKSQPNCNRFSVGNLTNAAAVLFSANTYQRLARFFDLAGIQWITKTCYYSIQDRYLHGVVNKFYKEQLKTGRNHGRNKAVKCG